VLPREIFWRDYDNKRLIIVTQPLRNVCNMVSRYLLVALVFFKPNFGDLKCNMPSVSAKSIQVLYIPLQFSCDNVPECKMETGSKYCQTICCI
jgi:hypothetical protein